MVPETNLDAADVDAPVQLLQQQQQQQQQRGREQVDKKAYLHANRRNRFTSPSKNRKSALEARVAQNRLLLSESKRRVAPAQE
jgi:hypothetical protein